MSAAFTTARKYAQIGAGIGFPVGLVVDNMLTSATQEGSLTLGFLSAGIGGSLGSLAGFIKGARANRDAQPETPKTPEI